MSAKTKNVLCLWCQLFEREILQICIFYSQDEFSSERDLFSSLQIQTKFFFSYGKFLHQETYFFKQKTRPIRKKKCHSTFNARHLSPFRMTKKLFCALARIFWPSARFWDFFGLQKAFGLLQAKKIPKTALRPKNLAAAQNFFLSFLIRVSQFFLDFEMNRTGDRYDQNEPPRIGPTSFGSNLKLPRSQTWTQISGNTNSIFTTKK